MTSFLLLFAEAEAQQQSTPPWFYAIYGLPLLMLFMMFRSNSKAKKDAQAALSAMKKNDRVVTSGGILGVIVSMKENEDEVTLRVDDTSNTRIRVLKSSIVRVTSGDATASETK